MRSFLLTSRIDPEGIIDHQRQTLVDAIQRVDRVSAADVVRVKNALPGISVVQVVHVNDTSAVSEADSSAGEVEDVRDFFSDFVKRTNAFASVDRDGAKLAAVDLAPGLCP